MAKKLDLKWRQEAFCVKDVAGFYKAILPIVVKAYDGYCGICDHESYSIGDMFFITGLETHKRIAVVIESQYRNQNTINISFPLDSKVLFNVVEDSQTKTPVKSETLEQIDRRICLKEGMTLIPCHTEKVRFKGVVDERSASITLGRMKIVKVFSQEYLTGYNLPEVTQPYDEAQTFPVHMDLRLYVAESMDGGTRDDYKQFLDNLLKKTKYFKHKSRVNGLSEIMQYRDDIDEEDPYEYLAPVDYIRLHDVKKQAAKSNTSTEATPKKTTTTTKHEKKAFRALPPVPPTHYEDDGYVTALHSRTPLKPDKSNSTEYDNNTDPKPTIVVKPSQQPEASEPAPDHAQESKDEPSHSGDCEYASFAEIPKDISNLSIPQIASCLKRMNMEKYIPVFDEFQVDGSLLLAFSKQELISDFGMNPTEATKINMFAHKHWRPATR